MLLTLLYFTTRTIFRTQKRFRTEKELSVKYEKTVDKNFISTYNLIRMETYRSGHNGAHSKCVSPPGHEGSNPSVSAEKAEAAAPAFCLHAGKFPPCLFRHQQFLQFFHHRIDGVHLPGQFHDFLPAALHHTCNIGKFLVF